MLCRLRNMMSTSGRHCNKNRNIVGDPSFRIMGQHERCSYSNGKAIGTVAVDRSTLVNKTYSPITIGKREPETPLTKHLKTKIKGAGPISVATFMQEALLNPKFGYYYTGGLTNQQKDSENVEQEIIGNRGDFVTSPEISSMFSELIGVWCLETWNRLDRPKNIQIIELGPGKGTLMHDLLSSIHVMNKKHSPLVKQFLDSKITIHMVEASPQLKQVQQNTLRISSDNTLPNIGEDIVISYCDIPIMWHETFAKVPDTSQEADSAVFFIAHEFFDALPVFQFEYTDRGWCEVLVDVNDDEDSDRPEHFKFVLAPSSTFANLLTGLSNVEAKIGNKLEISPVAMGIMENIGLKLSKQKGAALIIDYGNDESMGFTLQGIKRHTFTNSPLELPGQVDLSVFIDFSCLKNAVKKFAHSGVATWGPQNQNHFLYQMGIDVRLMQILRNPEIDDEMQKRIVGAYERLIDKDGMGSQYKVLCVSSPASICPAGFDIIPSCTKTRIAKPAELVEHFASWRNRSAPFVESITTEEPAATAAPTTTQEQESKSEDKKPQSIHRKPFTYM